MQVDSTVATAPPVTKFNTRDSDDLFPHQAELGPLPLPALADSARVHVTTARSSL